MGPNRQVADLYTSHSWPLLSVLVTSVGFLEGKKYLKVPCGVGGALKIFQEVYI